MRRAGSAIKAQTSTNVELPIDHSGSGPCRFHTASLSDRGKHLPTAVAEIEPMQGTCRNTSSPAAAYIQGVADQRADSPRTSLRHWRQGVPLARSPGAHAEDIEKGLPVPMNSPQIVDFRQLVPPRQLVAQCSSGVPTSCAKRGDAWKPQERGQGKEHFHDDPRQLLGRGAARCQEVTSGALGAAWWESPGVLSARLGMRSCRSTMASHRKLGALHRCSVRPALRPPRLHAGRCVVAPARARS
mmetsp:Transcript_81875/g.237427  ORF Transcript_81875/g.237427 Transcript_81875/m.237427 type:complete len:243 (+) Transcript_81875:807-1535(+)